MTEQQKQTYHAVIEEAGNGFAAPGEYVAGGGDVYRVVSTTGRIHTGSGSGAPNWMLAVIEDADWDDINDSEEPDCSVRDIREAQE